MTKLTATESAKILLQHATTQYNLPLSEKVHHRLTYNIHHSFDTLAAARRIITMDSELSRLQEETLLQFEAAALLHDIGRLYQHDIETNLKNNEYPHAENGYDILKKEGIHDPRILLAVKFHDKRDFSGLENEIDYITADKKEREKIMRTCQITRDADILENLEHLLYDQSPFLTALTKKENQTRETRSVSEEIFDSIKKKKYINKKIVETEAERLLFCYSWSFEISCEGTKTILKYTRFRERFADILMKMGVRKEVVDIVRG